MAFPAPGIELEGPPDHTPLTLEEPLGGGAFGVVFGAVDQLGTRFAVKFPQAGLFGGDAELYAFLNEVQAASEIRHTNVVSVLHVETDPESLPPYLVMEYADGGTLQDVIDEARRADSALSLDRILAIGFELLDGLEAIHERMLHRDLKPDNVLFSDDAVKISDFGLSKLIGAATRSATFKGGQHMLYMAPEGWKGEENTTQLDLYALGIILYELATLDYPYERPAGNDAEQLRRMHLVEPPVPLRDRRPELPGQFCDVVMKLIEKRPGDRYADCSEVRSALEKIEQDPDEASPATRIAAAISRRREEALVETLRAEAERTEREEREDLDRYQRDRLKADVRDLIDEINGQSERAKIQVSESGESQLKLTIPHAGTGDLEFFRVDPPLKLKRGEVRFAGAVTDSKGCGFNLLLVRQPPDDDYGVWVVCHVGVSGLSGRRHRHCEKFAFGPGEIEHIGRADAAMHIYTVDFSDDVKGSVEGFLLELAGE